LSDELWHDSVDDDAMMMMMMMMIGIKMMII